MRNFLFFLFILNIQVTYGQAVTSDRYIDSLKKIGVDTFLILKSGTSNSNDTPEATIEKQNVYVLSKYRNKFTVGLFDTANGNKLFTADTTSIFNFNKSELLKKTKFFAEKNNSIDKRVLEPNTAPKNFSFEHLQIILPGFNYDIHLITNDHSMINLSPDCYPAIFTDIKTYSNCKLKKEKWFVITKDIIAKFNTLQKNLGK